MTGHTCRNEPSCTGAMSGRTCQVKMNFHIERLWQDALVEINLYVRWGYGMTHL